MGESMLPPQNIVVTSKFFLYLIILVWNSYFEKNYFNLSIFD